MFTKRLLTLIDFWELRRLTPVARWFCAALCMPFALILTAPIVRAVDASSPFAEQMMGISVPERLEGEVLALLRGCVVGSRLRVEYGSSCVDLSTDGAGWVRVLLAPQWYLQHIGLNLDVGGYVTVQGAFVDTGLGTFFFANRIWSDAVQYELRDHQGTATWLHAFPMQ